MTENKRINLTQFRTLSDNELIKVVQLGQIDLFAIIIERYQGKLFAYLYRLICGREEAEDLLQDVFVKTFKNIQSYDSSRKFSSWIYRIAHNEAVNYIKRKSLKKCVSWEDMVSTKDILICNDMDNGADDMVLRKEIINEVDKAINRLPIKYKQILLLRYYSEKSYEEIGDILQKPVNTVGTLISRAKKKMAIEIKKINGGSAKKIPLTKLAGKLPQYEPKHIKGKVLQRIKKDQD